MITNRYLIEDNRQSRYFDVDEDMFIDYDCDPVPGYELGELMLLMENDPVRFHKCRIVDIMNYFAPVKFY